MIHRIAFALLCGGLLCAAALVCVADMLRVEQLVQAQSRLEASLPPDGPAAPDAGERPWARAGAAPGDGLRGDSPGHGDILDQLGIADGVPGPRDFSRPVILPAYRPFGPLGDLDTPTQKKVDKLDKKLLKQQTKLDVQETRLAEFELELVELHDALAAAEALPQDTPTEAKARAKAIKKANARIAKQLKRIAKLQKKTVATTDKIAGTLVQLEDLDPGHVDQLGPVDGLRVAARLSLATVGIGSQGGPQGDPGDDVADFPPEADFFTDPASAHVWGPAAEPLELVNDILCGLDLTGYQQMVNRGPYQAQVDPGLCIAGDDGRASATPEGQSAGASAIVPSLWTVNSARGSDTGLQVVRVWAPMAQRRLPQFFTTVPAGQLIGKVVASEGVSLENPFGRFRFDFAQVDDETTLKKPRLRGYVSTLVADPGQIGLALFTAEGNVDKPGDDYARSVHAVVTMGTDQATGSAHVRVRWRPAFDEDAPPADGDDPQPDANGVFTEQFVVVFDETHAQRVVSGGEPQCLDRDAFALQSWRYNLYHAEGPSAGERVELDEGFGVRTVSGLPDDDSGSYGWAGHHGVVLHDGSLPEHGQVVVRDEVGDETGDEYTVFVAPGRLVRHERLTTSLATVDGMIFEWIELPDPAPPGDGGGAPSEPVTFRVEYDHVTGEFVKVARFVPERGIDEWLDLGVQQAIDVVGEGGWLELWSDGLGGMAFYPAGAGEITFWRESAVDGDDELFGGGDDVSLFATVNALRTGITGAEAEQGDLYLPPAIDVANAHEYTFDRATLGLLYDDGDGPHPVGLVEGEAAGMGPFAWGVRTGPLVVDTGPLVAVDDVWTQDVFYTYETGPNRWNRFSALLDDQGAFARFDAPLEFMYTHSGDNDANGDETYSDKAFVLRYEGPGELHGIPDTAADLDGDEQRDRFYPLFSIADGTLVGPVAEYVVKATDTEVNLLEAEIGCEDFEPHPVFDLALPDGKGYAKPNVGPEPELDAPPAVIDGVAQEAPAAP